MAFDDAVKLDYHVRETDVHITRDGKLIAFDEQLEKFKPYFCVSTQVLSSEDAKR